jgi:Putative lumazine-binding
MDSDYAGIFAAVGHYVRGAKTGQSDEMAKAFAPGATIYGHDSDGLFAGPIQKLLDWNTANGPAADIQATIHSVEIAQSVATVRLEIDHWTGQRFTDLFTLIKLDSRWQIVNKVFHLHP